jgi:hypothetical protein
MDAAWAAVIVALLVPVGGAGLWVGRTLSRVESKIEALILQVASQNGRVGRLEGGLEDVRVKCAAQHGGKP